MYRSASPFAPLGPLIRLLWVAGNGRSLTQQLRPGACRPRALAEQTAVIPGAGLPGIEPEHVAGDRRQSIALRELPLRVSGHPLEQRLAAGRLETRLVPELALQLAEHEGAVIGLATQHHAITPSQRLEHTRRGRATRR